MTTRWRWMSDWLRLNLLEGRLLRRGYRRLHEEQVADVTMRTRLMIHELADAVVMLRTVADEVESALLEMEGDPDDR